MLIITMDLCGKHSSQYIWHIGELFPCHSKHVQHIIRVYADGDELETIVRTPNKRSLYVDDPKQAKVIVERLRERYSL